MVKGERVEGGGISGAERKTDTRPIGKGVENEGEKSGDHVLK